MKTMANVETLDLRSLYQRYSTEALIIAAVFHFALIGSFQMYSQFMNADRITDQLKPFREIIIDRIPVWINNGQVIPNITVAKMIRTNVGFPIPIPDAEINPAATIPQQSQLNEPHDGTVVVEGGTGTPFTEGKYIENTEAPSKEFIPGIEKYPVIISNPAPKYPDIALRAGVEGTVYIKMWVTKEGKVRSAEVAKSTSNIFNQEAVSAAIRWTFTPAIMNNAPVSVWVTVPFKFRINSKI